jgi:hypothetical protein
MTTAYSKQHFIIRYDGSDLDVEHRTDDIATYINLRTADHTNEVCLSGSPAALVALCRRLLLAAYEAEEAALGDADDAGGLDRARRRLAADALAPCRPALGEAAVRVDRAGR